MYQILTMHVVWNPHHTLRSAARHAEQANCLLLSPEHRHIPQNLQPQAAPVITPLRLGLNPNHHPFLLGEEPFMLPPPPPSLPPGPPPATVRRLLEDLHAQAAAAAAQMIQPLGQRQRGRRIQRGDVPLPAPACPPFPDDQVLISAFTSIFLILMLFSSIGTTSLSLSLDFQPHLMVTFNMPLR